MFGWFRIGKMQVAIDEREILQVIRLAWLHRMPGLPQGIQGLIEYEGFYLPLLATDIVLSLSDGEQSVSFRSEDGSADPRGQCFAVVTRLDEEIFALPVDEVLALEQTRGKGGEEPIEEGEGSNTLWLDCRRLWREIRRLNGASE